MLKYLLTIIFICFSCYAKAKPEAMKNYQYCNEHKFTFLFMKVYDVYLCNNDKKNFKPRDIYKSDFSLIIKYDLNFDKEELSKSSLEEIARYYEVEEKRAKEYFNQLMKVFPNVKKGDVIEAKYSKKGSINFYHNKVSTGIISDAKFAEIFLDIWLHPDNHYESMRKDLWKK